VNGVLATINTLRAHGWWLGSSLKLDFVSSCVSERKCWVFFYQRVRWAHQTNNRPLDYSYQSICRRRMIRLMKMTKRPEHCDKLNPSPSLSERRDLSVKPIHQVPERLFDCAVTNKEKTFIQTFLNSVYGIVCFPVVGFKYRREWSNCHSTPPLAFLFRFWVGCDSTMNLHTDYKRALAGDRPFWNAKVNTKFISKLQKVCFNLLLKVLSEMHFEFPLNGSFHSQAPRWV